MEPILLKYALSCCAAAVAESVTFPLDLTKTRLQMQVTRGGAPALGMFGMARSVVASEGVLGLWGGISPAILRHFVYSGSRIVFYEQIRSLSPNQNKAISLPQAIAASMVSGGSAQFIATPTDLVKVRMQLDGKRVAATGEAPLYRNVLHAFRCIYREEGGIAGLYRGSMPNVQRAALVQCGDLATYDLAKRWILANTPMEDNSMTHALSSICAGFVAATLGTPADVIKTRIMNQRASVSASSSPEQPRYRGSIDCVVKTVKHEGVMSLYKGFLPCWIRMAPWSLAFWLTFEQIRRLTGVQSF